MITYEDFSRLELRIARIEAAEAVQGSDKLLRLTINIGSDKRQLVAGIAREYPSDQLIGKTIVIVANLAPRSIKGIESQGMLLAADVDGKPVLLTTDREVPPGAPVR